MSLVLVLLIPVDFQKAASGIGRMELHEIPSIMGHLPGYADAHLFGPGTTIILGFGAIDLGDDHVPAVAVTTL